MIKELESGYIRIGVNGGFAQIPKGFIGEIISDEYIFQPEWCREEINQAWLESWRRLKDE